ncbi:MAG: response regulator [Prevotellaceae bacterium]|jgi:signal transduction histidine kinase/CheY-like chemotaxis protein|nr:response regulator [Prevotellaceae bacterium]
MVIENNFYRKSTDKDTSDENILKIVSVLAAHGMALWEYDIPSDTCYLPSEYFRILGLDKIGIYFTDVQESFAFIHPDDLPEYKKFYTQILTTDVEKASLSYRFLGPNGDILWAEDHFSLFRKEGAPGGLIVYTINVTEARLKDQKIVQLAEHNQHVIEALPDFIFIFNEGFILTEVIKSSTSELLHSVEELTGLDGRDLYSPEVSELFINNIHACLEDKEIHEIEYSLLNKGQTFYFQARLAPFENNMVMALIRDVGDRVRRSKELIEAKRRAEESDRMKNIFLATMSHEIRTPLNAIVGFSEIVSLTQDEEEKEEYLEIIRKNSGLLLQLIDDILDLSRIEAGKTEMHISEVSLKSIVEDVQKVCQMKIPKDVALNIALPSEDIIAQSDRNRLNQVMTNFMTNAIKNTRRGAITIGLSHEGDCARLYVSDTGIGIPKEKQQSIFNRFEKLNDFAQGTGLGLSICKNIADRLGATIEVESEPGVGSTFSLVLHLHSQTAPVIHIHQAKKILIVEDSETSFKQLKSILMNDYTLLWHKDHEDAMGLFISENPDLIILNMQLSDCSGTEIIERIRLVSSQVPIIAIIDHAYYTDQRMAFQAGCNEVIVKPYSVNRLLETVETLLRVS